jgi:hypothetical protein
MSLNVVFKRASIEASMEFGSLKELAGYIGEESATLSTIFGEDMEIVAKGISGGAPVATSGEEVAGEQGGARRGRKPKDKNQPDPATATAPPPAPIPGATPPAAPAVPAPELSAQVAAAVANGGGIPPFLDRAATPAAPPAPPPPPPAVPAAPVVPPSGILAGKVIADLDRRGTDDTTKAALVTWLASPGLALVMANATYDDAISAIRLMPDDKLSGLATALSVS